jgi:hypothetical protein
MPQTANSIWGGAAKVEISTNGSSWTDVSGHSALVSPSPSQRRQGQAYVFNDENPIVKVGKKQVQTTRIDIVYTEETADAYEVARAQYEAAGGGTMYIRWSPAGGNGGDSQLSTGSGFVSEFQYPPVDAEADGPIKTYFIVQSSSITTATVAT